MYKQTLSIAVIAVLAATLMSAAVFSDVQAVKPAGNNKQAKVKPVKCNAPVKIQLGVKGLDGTGNQTIMGVVVLNGVSKSKTITTEENETFTVLNFLFKKMVPCPAVGDAYSGFVNGTDFSGTLTSLKKPNRVSVDLP